MEQIISRLVDQQQSTLLDTKNRLRTKWEGVNSLAKQIAQSPIRRRLPFGIRLGSHADHEITIVAPLVGQVPYFFQYSNNSSQQNTHLLLQQIVVDVIEATNREEVKIMVMDFSRNSFPFLNKLSAPFVEILADERKAQSRLEMVNMEVSRIHADCVTAGYNSILQYNESAEYPEPFHLLVVSNFDQIQDAGLLSLLQNLSTRQEAGFYLLATGPKKNDESKLSYTQAEQKRQLIRSDWSILDVDMQLIRGRVTGLEDMGDLKIDISIDHAELAERVKTLKANQEIANQQNNFLRVPIGRVGARPFSFELGEGVGAYHVLVGGQTGSGKSNLLNNLIVQVGELYSSDEVRLQLMDYKGGVEFACFKDHPSVEVLLTDNEDINSGLEVLAQLQKQIEDRSRLFLRVGAKNIEGYRAKSGKSLHRVLLIIDEFQVLFSGRNRDQANRLLKDVARRGRSFGLHLILSSQSLKDYALDTDLKNQLAARIVLSIDANECGNFLHVDNDAPTSLPKYHAVVNTMGGKKAFNQIVKLNYLSDDDLTHKLVELQATASGAVFEQQIFAVADTGTLAEETAIKEEIQKPGNVDSSAFDDLLDSMGMKPEEKSTDKKTGDSAFDDLLDSFNI